MIWVSLGLLALAALVPLGLMTLRQGAAARGRREAALALHRAQLDELDREREDGRLTETEHEAAVLEVQRRLLAADTDHDGEARRTSRFPLYATLAIIPAAALGLYLIGGSPELPAEPLAARRAAAEARAKEATHLATQLRGVLAKLDPKSEEARKGYVMLGSLELSRGDFQAAATAWQTALATRFDPTLGAETAEVLTEMSGVVTPEAAALFRRALAEAPADAPWRPMAERRIKDAPAD
ncbi:MAG TPA: c-type cytochrome biogenesis protein CcmI [Acidisphaera sp.]|nr:c-type cytochrome biogenesis protein CcmI [Acidisphaera sp.]